MPVRSTVCPRFTLPGSSKSRSGSPTGLPLIIPLALSRPKFLLLIPNAKSRLNPFAMMEWNIQSRAHACQACDTPFTDGEPYHTLLFDQKHGYEGWMSARTVGNGNTAREQADRKGFVSHWQGSYESPPAAPPEPIAKETAETLLRKLIELNDPQYVAACYILAVMLERKRLLRVQTEQRREGKRIFIYEHPKNGDLFTILDPELQLDELDGVQHMVAHLIKHGLHPTPPDSPGETPNLPSRVRLWTRAQR